MLLKIQVIGYVGKDAEVKTFENGGSVINFNVASTEKYFNAQGEPVEQTTWINCSLFKKAGEKTTIADYIKKGTRIFIEGRPSVRSYTNPQGQAGASLECRVGVYRILEKFIQGETTANEHIGQSVYPQQQAQQQPQTFQDDLPF